MTDLAQKVAEIIDEQLEGFAKQWGIEIRRLAPFVWEWDGTEIVKISVYPTWVVVGGGDLNCLFVKELNSEMVGKIIEQVYEAIEAVVIERYYERYRGEWILENGDILAVIFQLKRENWSFQIISSSGRWNCNLLEGKRGESPFRHFDAVARSVALLALNLPVTR